MIYLIVDEAMQYGKIGYSGNPLGRLATMQTGIPLTLKLLNVIPGNQEDETELHNKFNEYKVRGEWFILDDSIIAYMNSKEQLAPNKKVVRLPRIGDHPVYKVNPWEIEGYKNTYRREEIKSKHGKNMLEYIKSLLKVYDTLYIPREGYNLKYGHKEDHKQHYYRGIEEMLRAGVMARQAGSTMWFYMNPTIVNSEGKIKLRNLERYNKQ